MYLYLICKSHILTNLPLPTETHRSNKRAKVYGLTLDPSAKKILRHMYLLQRQVRQVVVAWKMIIKS